MATKNKDAAAEPKTVTVTTSTGLEFDVPVGADGKNPVSPNNPPAGAISEADVQVVKDAQAKIEERQAQLQESGSDGPGNEHNADGIATDADKRDSVRPDTTKTGDTKA